MSYRLHGEDGGVVCRTGSEGTAERLRAQLEERTGETCSVWEVGP